MTPLPSPWVALVLGLAAFRLTRLGGWDDFPPIERVRAWIIGESWNAKAGVPETTLPTYRRPLLAHLVHCAFCLGAWISLAVYLWWILTPEWGLYPLAPFALSGFVGLVAKNWDP